jgi:hypothetical protein
MHQALAYLKNNGRVDETNAQVASFTERQRLVKKSLFDELESKYVGKP